MFGPSGIKDYGSAREPWTMDCASTRVQSKERTGSNFAIWQPWRGRKSRSRAEVVVASATTLLNACQIVCELAAEEAAVDSGQTLKRNMLRSR